MSYSAWIMEAMRKQGFRKASNALCIFIMFKFHDYQIHWQNYVLDKQNISMGGLSFITSRLKYVLLSLRPGRLESHWDHFSISNPFK